MKPLANQEGMALLLVLVVVALLSALLTEFSFSTLVDLRATETFRDRTKAFYLARGGVEAARMILQEDKNLNNFDHPAEFWGALPSIPVGDGEVSLQIRDLTGRLNLNEIADNKGRPGIAYTPFVELCKEVLNLDDAQAEELRDSIAHWLNGDRSMVSADDNYYAQQQPAYARKGADLETLDELNLVRHFDADVIRRLRPYVRVGDDKYPINLNTAPAEVLLAWQYWSTQAPMSLDRQDIDALVSYRRRSPLRKKGDLDSVPGLINRWSGTWQAGTVAVKGELFEVKSTGRINQGIRVAEAVVRKSDNQLRSLKVE